MGNSHSNNELTMGVTSNSNIRERYLEDSRLHDQLEAQRLADSDVFGFRQMVM